MKEIVIREWIESDSTALAVLTTELGYATTVEEMQKRMCLMAKNPDYKTLVAVVDNEIAGYIGLIKNYVWERNGHYIRIQTLVIKQEHRRNGIGKELVQKAKAWAEETGAVLIIVNCSHRPEREGAHRFYPQMGFRATSTGYIQKLKRGNR